MVWDRQHAVLRSGMKTELTFPAVLAILTMYGNARKVTRVRYRTGFFHSEEYQPRVRNRKDSPKNREQSAEWIGSLVI